MLFAKEHLLALQKTHSYSSHKNRSTSFQVVSDNFTKRCVQDYLLASQETNSY